MEPIKMINDKKIASYIGAMSQMAGIKSYTLDDGKARGVRCLDMKTGSGLEFTVVPDRCMDIAWATFNGSSLCHITKNGLISANYHEPEGDGWLRNYFGGLLSTCGLSNTGAPCEDEGQQYGLHGRIGNIPAENVCKREYWNNGQFIIETTGTMRESIFYGENLFLTRSIKTALGSNKIIIHDEVGNEGFSAVPLMILYHFNIGYPLLNERSTLALNPSDTDFYDHHSESGKNEMFSFQAPTHKYFRQVFFHSLRTYEEGNTLVVVKNEESTHGCLGLSLQFNTHQLPEFFEFKMMGEGDYQLGLEPSNCLPMGRSYERSRNGLKFIQPGEVQSFDFEIEVITEKEKMSELLRAIERMK